VVRALASHQCVPGSIRGPGVICGLSLLLVLALAPSVFLQVLRFSSCHILCFLHDVVCHPINTGTSHTCMLALSSECIKQFVVYLTVSTPPSSKINISKFQFDR